MTLGYWIASGVLLIALLLVALASHYGWGLPSDAKAMAQSRSVRTGSLHTRHYYGGGPGFGK
jgi:hypothetical protein